MGNEFFDITDQERINLRKVMNRILRKDGKGNFLVEDLVRENQD